MKIISFLYTILLTTFLLFGMIGQFKLIKFLVYDEEPHFGEHEDSGHYSTKTVGCPVEDEDLQMNGNEGLMICGMHPIQGLKEHPLIFSNFKELSNLGNFKFKCPSPHYNIPKTMDLQVILLSGPTNDVSDSNKELFRSKEINVLCNGQYVFRDLQIPYNIKIDPSNENLFMCFYSTKNLYFCRDHNKRPYLKPKRNMWMKVNKTDLKDWKFTSTKHSMKNSIDDEVVNAVLGYFTIRKGWLLREMALTYNWIPNCIYFFVLIALVKIINNVFVYCVHRRCSNDSAFQKTRHWFNRGGILDRTTPLVQIRDRIGANEEGAYGEIFEYGLTKVVKEYKYNINAEEEAIKALRDQAIREAYIHGLMDHKNVVKIFGVCYRDDRSVPLLILERCEMSLHDLIQEHRSINSKDPIYLRLKFDQKVDIISQNFEGLRHIHEKNIIHRDLKLSNILVKSITNSNGDISYQTKLADMGSSGEKYSILNTNRAVAVTVLYYKPPEYNLKDKNGLKDSCVESFDVYSMGIVMYSIIYMVFPENHKTCFPKGKSPTMMETLTDNLIKDDYRMKYLIDLMMKCVSVQPSERPSVSKCIEELNRIKNLDENKPEFPLLHSVKETYKKICHYFGIIMSFLNVCND